MPRRIFTLVSIAQPENATVLNSLSYEEAVEEALHHLGWMIIEDCDEAYKPASYDNEYLKIN